MLRNCPLFFAALCLFAITSCSDENQGCTDPTATNYSLEATEEDGSCVYPNTEEFTITENGTIVTVAGKTDVDFTFTADKIWLMKAFVYVRDGATLTVEPGTVIKGDKSSKASLIIERGAKINAVGTQVAPIVFTSSQPVGQRSYGDWGGLILCGNAAVNLPGGEGYVEGGVGSLYGGNVENDNSGKLKYSRIEFAGIPFQPNTEINGLTLAAVGSETEIEFIQVSYCGDDSYEWFGGNVNARHLVSFRGWDDDFDTDNGYSGKLQYLVALRDPQVADASGSSGFESDNNPEGNSTSPFTTPVFSNVSLFGPLAIAGTPYNTQHNSGMHLRRNTKLRVHNTVVAGFPFGIQVQHNFTETNAENDDLRVRGTIVTGCENPLNPADLFSTFAPYDWFFTSAYNNDTLATNDELQLADPFNLQSPDFMPTGSSPLLSGAVFTHPDLQDAFFEQVNFIGAFGTDDWTEGWTNWDPQNTVY